MYLISQCLRLTKLSEMTMSLLAECLPRAAPFLPIMYTLFRSWPSTALSTRMSESLKLLELLLAATAFPDPAAAPDPELPWMLASLSTPW